MLKVVQQNDGESHEGMCLASNWSHAVYNDNHTDKQLFLHDCSFCSFAGYFPVVLEALPEGTCVHAHCPVFQVGTYLRN